jgi:hypothetical protein
MTVTDDPVERDLEDMAGDPKLAKSIRRSLEQLRDGSAGPALAEMAKDVLEGRTDLRAVARSAAYAGELTEGLDQYKSWEAQLTPEERVEFDREARTLIYDDPDGRHG